jgi:hypothetical protein
MVRHLRSPYYQFGRKKIAIAKQSRRRLKSIPFRINKHTKMNYGRPVVKTKKMKEKKKEKKKRSDKRIKRSTIDDAHFRFPSLECCKNKTKYAAHGYVSVWLPLLLYAIKAKY